MDEENNCTIMAGHIISALGSLFQPAWDISVVQLISKIKSLEELEFYYKWLCTTYTARGYIE